MVLAAIVAAFAHLWWLVRNFFILVREIELIPFVLEKLHIRKNENRERRTRILNQILQESSPEKYENYYAIVTGANSGIGYETARVLALKGYNVIVACRSRERGEEAVNGIKKELAKGSKTKVEFMPLDLSSLDSVKQFADMVVKQRKLPVNLLINNAGIMATPYQETKEGFELQFGTNHLGHFLLTKLLLDTLEANKPSRIVVVASDSHEEALPVEVRYKGFDLMTRAKDSSGNDICKPVTPYNRFHAYSQSKLCNVLFAYELHRRLNNSGSSGIAVNVLHPGVVYTNINTNLFFPLNHIAAYLFKTVAKTPLEGAATSLYVALNEDELAGVSGKYFVDCTMHASSPLSHDREQARRLWDISEELVQKWLN